MTKIHLSRTDEAGIRRLRKLGRSYSEIAKKYGISRPRAYYICEKAKSRYEERLCKCGSLLSSPQSISLGLCRTCRKRFSNLKAKTTVPVAIEDKPKTFREKVRSVLYKAVNVLLQLD